MGGCHPSWESPCPHVGAPVGPLWAVLPAFISCQVLPWPPQHLLGPLPPAPSRRTVQTRLWASEVPSEVPSHWVIPCLKKRPTFGTLHVCSPHLPFGNSRWLCLQLQEKQTVSQSPCSHARVPEHHRTQRSRVVSCSLYAFSRRGCFGHVFDEADPGGRLEGSLPGVPVKQLTVDSVDDFTLLDHYLGSHLTEQKTRPSDQTERI